MPTNMLASDLTNALSLIVPLTKSNARIPIFTFTQLEFYDSHLSLTASNGTTSLRVIIPAVSQVCNSICVKTEGFYSLLKSLPASTFIDIDTSNNLLSVKSNYSSYLLSTHTGSDYPKIPELDIPQTSTLLIPANTFCDITAKTIPFASSDQSYPALNCCKLSIDQSDIQCIASDGKILSFCARKLDQVVDVEVERLIPFNELSFINYFFSASKAKPIHITPTIDGLHFRCLNMIAYTKTSPDTYPPALKLIRSKSSTKFIVDRKLIETTTRRLKPLSSEQSLLVTRCVPSFMTIAANNTQFDCSGSETIAIESFDGYSIDIGVNHHYLSSVLSKINSNYVSIELNTPTSPIIFKPAEINSSIDCDNDIFLISPNDTHKLTKKKGF